MGIHLHHSHDHSDHGHGLAHGEGGGIARALSWALVITIVFMIIELVGGLVANSLALLSDAAHLLTDVGAILLSLFAYWVSRKPSTTTMSFGYHRAEILGALASGLMIWLLSGLLVYEAILRLKAPPEVNAPIVLVVAGVGFVANLLSMYVLNSSKKESMNVRAAYLHMLADAMGSAAAVIAGLVLMFTGWRPIDPIITIFFAILMLVSSWTLVKESVQVLMESTPGHLDPAQIQKDLVQLAGVREAHDLHVWTVATGRFALSVHLIAESEEVLTLANALLEERYSIRHTTIQIEKPESFQSERCYDCVPAK
jgi:cobalt-zinc-cadmium efflux system protein